MDYLKIVQKNFQEWKTQGFCSEADNLNKQIGKEYFNKYKPHFFTGDLTAELVLIMLNPKQKNPDEKYDFSSWEEYYDAFARFGRKHYGPDADGSHKSPFDHKQVRFLEPFNILPFTKDERQNLEIVVDKKLQLELIPFGSPEFNFRVIGIDLLKPYIERCLSVLSMYPRKYVIFCGRVFSELLKDYLIKEPVSYKFRLKKKDGKSLTKSEYEAVNIELAYQGKKIIACIAPQFALQGAPIAEYGKKISELYALTNADIPP